MKVHLGPMVPACRSYWARRCNLASDPSEVTCALCLKAGTAPEGTPTVAVVDLGPCLTQSERGWRRRQQVEAWTAAMAILRFEHPDEWLSLLRAKGRTAAGRELRKMYRERWREAYALERLSTLAEGPPVDMRERFAPDDPMRDWL